MVFSNDARKKEKGTKMKGPARNFLGGTTSPERFQGRQDLGFGGGEKFTEVLLLKEKRPLDHWWKRRKELSERKNIFYEGKERKRGFRVQYDGRTWRGEDVASGKAGREVDLFHTWKERARRRCRTLRWGGSGHGGALAVREG